MNLHSLRICIDRMMRDEAYREAVNVVWLRAGRFDFNSKNLIFTAFHLIAPPCSLVLAAVCNMHESTRMCALGLGNVLRVISAHGSASIFDHPEEVCEALSKSMLNHNTS